MIWTINYLRSAKRGLKGVSHEERQRLKIAIEQLANEADPQAKGKKLKGSQLQAFYRIRVGNYRVIYKTENRELILLIIKVGHRKDIYR